MTLNPYLIPTASTMAILAMVYLLFVFWVRRPGRRFRDQEMDADEVLHPEQGGAGLSPRREAPRR